MSTALTLISLPFGLAFGSFATVLATRGLGHDSFVSPGSRCDTCHAAIARRDNIPVLSWLLLRGRCRHCGDAIPVSYPIAELATAVLFAVVTWSLGPTWTLPAYLVFVTACVALTLTDLEAKRLPNRVVFPADAIGGVLLILGSLLDGDPEKLTGALIGAVGYSGVMMVVHLIAPTGLGFGDVKLAVLLGMFLGYQSLWHVAAGFFFAYLAGGVVSIVLVVTRVRSMKDAIPFGPYMMAAALLMVVAGEGILDAYLGRL